MMNYEFDYDRSLTSINSILRTAVYYQKTDDLLANPVTAPLAPGAGGLVSYAQNVGSSSAVGGEIGLKGTSESGIHWNISYALISISDRLSIGPLNGPSLLLDYEHGSPASVVNIGSGYSWGRFDVMRACAGNRVHGLQPNRHGCRSAIADQRLYCLEYPHAYRATDGDAGADGRAAGAGADFRSARNAGRTARSPHSVDKILSAGAFHHGERVFL